MSQWPLQLPPHPTAQVMLHLIEHSEQLDAYTLVES